MEIITVQTKADLKEFIRLPWKIYKNDQFWVPPLISNMEFVLDQNKNPFWEHAKQKLFLAKNKGETVGRIAGIIDESYLKLHREKVGHFGFFEVFNDYETAKVLLEQVKEWLKENGMQYMRGPFNPSQNEEWGLLVKGFDSSPALMTTYNPPYYTEMLEKYGLQKSLDLYAYSSKTHPRLPKIFQTSLEFAKRKFPKAVVRKINLKKIEREKEILKNIYNSTFEKSWGFVPMTKKEVNALIDRMRLLIRPELILFLEIKGEPIGILVASPDYNEALKKINGRLFPFGWLKFLYNLRKVKTMRLAIIGIIEEYRMKGLEALLIEECNKNAYKLGFKKMEFSWILENNINSRKAAEYYGAKLYKTYRIYEMKI